MKKRTVALYSRHMVLSKIGACLKKNTVFQVEQIDGPFEIIGKMSPPDVILFVFETAQSDFALTMMRDHPGDHADKGGSGEKQNAGAVECVVPSADH